MTPYWAIKYRLELKNKKHFQLCNFTLEGNCLYICAFLKEIEKLKLEIYMFFRTYIQSWRYNSLIVSKQLKQSSGCQVPEEELRWRIGLSRQQLIRREWISENTIKEIVLGGIWWSKVWLKAAEDFQSLICATAVLNLEMAFRCYSIQREGQRWNTQPELFSISFKTVDTLRFKM